MRRHHEPLAEYAPILLTVLVLGAVGPPLALSGPAAADGMAQFSVEPSTEVVQPGETFTVDLDLRSTPQFASGAAKVGIVVTFNSTSVTAADVEQGPFMSNGERTTVEVNRSEIHNEEGFLIYELERTPPKGGVTGEATFATVTFRAKETAPSGRVEIGVAKARILLTDGMPQQVTTTPGAIELERGSPRHPETAASRAGEPNGSTAGAVAPSNPGDDGGTTPLLLLALLGVSSVFGVTALGLRRIVPSAAGGEPSPGDTAGTSEPIIACPVCGDEFQDGPASRDHTWDAHGACHHCGETFESRESLYAHWLAHHTDALSGTDTRTARQTLGLATSDASGGSGSSLELGALRPSVGRRTLVLAASGLLLALVLLGVTNPIAGGILDPGPDEGTGTGHRASFATPHGETGPDGHTGTRQSTTTIGELGSVHWHATLEVRIDGQRVDFSKDPYMLRSKFVHFENGDGRTVHKHATGVTLTDVFFTIDWQLTNRCLVTPDGREFCGSDGATLDIVVNGDEIDDPSAYRLQDDDRIRIVYESSRS